MKKILLRAIEPEDLETLYDIENDSTIWEVGVTNVPYSHCLLRDYIAESRGDIFADGQVRLMVDNEEGKTVGIADLMNFDPRNRRAEVGIVIAPEYRRKGYATATLKAVEDYARRIIHLHQVYAIVDKENVSAIRLFQTAGYHTETELADWLYDGTTYRPAVLVKKILN